MIAASKLDLCATARFHSSNKNIRTILIIQLIDAGFTKALKKENLTLFGNHNHQIFASGKI
jgi:hypothetical protein